MAHSNHEDERTPKRRKLSFAWQTILRALDRYGDEGVVKGAFIEMMGDPDAGGYRNHAKDTLNQMFFTGVEYYERHPDDRSKIRITAKGKDALEHGGLL